MQPLSVSTFGFSLVWDCIRILPQTGEEIPYGLCVWSTGVGPTDFTTSLPFAKTPKGARFHYYSLVSSLPRDCQPVHRSLAF